LPKPASSAAFSIELWPSCEAYTTSGASSPWSPAPFWLKPELFSRAHRSAQSVAVLAVRTTPVQVSDRPTIWRSQSITTSSTSVAAGLVCQLMPWTPRPEATMSARIDA
jgi:hypothetical protein